MRTKEPSLALLGRDHHACTGGAAVSKPEALLSDLKQRSQHMVGRRQASKLMRFARADATYLNG
jgi:hypothetical protein